MLVIRRPELQAYLRALAQPWREDASNLDPQFARNRVRHRILPLLESELNPRVRELLAETAEIARAEEDYWAAEIAGVVAAAWTTTGEGKQGYLRIGMLQQHPLALQRRAVRAIAESLGAGLEFAHVEELLRLALAPASGEKQVVLPGGWRVRRVREQLQFEPPRTSKHPEDQEFSYFLPLPGEVEVPEIRTVFRAVLGPISAGHAGWAYDRTRLPDVLRVRNWHPGDRFWPGHTRGPRKVKELLQERKIPLAERRGWPVITSAAPGETEIIWMRGFPPPQELLVTPEQAQGVVIEEHALQGARHKAE